MTPEDFKRKGHERPTAYVKESHPSMGVKLYDQWVAPQDLENFALWIIGASKWCQVQLNNEVQSKEGLKQVQEPEGLKEESPARSLPQRSKKRN